MEKEKNIFEKFEEEHWDFFKENGRLSQWYDFISSDINQNPSNIVPIIKEGLPPEIKAGLLKLFPPYE